MTELEIRELANSMRAEDVVVYTQLGCAYCELAMRWLDDYGFKYIECDIGTDSDCAAAFKRYRATGTPYVVARRNGNVRHLREGFTSSAFLKALT